jgi:hypothetical protein
MRHIDGPERWSAITIRETVNAIARAFPLLTPRVRLVPSQTLEAAVGGRKTNGSPVTDKRLGHLAGASSLVALSLDGMPLTAAGLKRVSRLDLPACCGYILPFPQKLASHD